MKVQQRLLNHRPPRIAMTMLGVAALLWLLFPHRLHPSLPVAAGITGLLGFAIMMRAWWLFRLAHIGICPTEPTNRLLSRDVYSWSRHPMYLGILLMLLAVALFTGEAAFYAVVAINFVVLNNVFCAYEERKLEYRFGRPYRKYRHRVRRWL